VKLCGATFDDPQGVTHPAQDWALDLRSMRFNVEDSKSRLRKTCSNSLHWWRVAGEISPARRIILTTGLPLRC